MKKLMMLGIFIVTAVILTGCGKEKSLTCTYTLDTNEVKGTMEYSFSFDKKGESLTKYDKKDTAEYIGDKKEEEIEEIYQSGLKACEDLKDFKGVKCDIEKENRKIIAHVEVKLKELDSDSTDVLFTQEAENKDYEGFKSMMEQTGFTCK